MISMTIRGMAQARRDLQALMLPPRRKARVLRKMGQHIARRSRARITGQESLYGGKFAPRKLRRDEVRKSSRKLLLGFRRRVRVRLQGDTAVISVGSGLWATRARQHQEGFTQVVRAKLADAAGRGSRRHRASPEGPGVMATRRQARRLRELGWRQSQKKLMATYSRRFAGFLIRKEEGRQPKNSWRIVVPARPFLGASAADRAELRRIVLAELRKTG